MKRHDICYAIWYPGSACIPKGRQKLIMIRISDHEGLANLIQVIYLGGVDVIMGCQDKILKTHMDVWISEGLMNINLIVCARY